MMTIQRPNRERVPFLAVIEDKDEIPLAPWTALACLPVYKIASKFLHVARFDPNQLASQSENIQASLLYQISDMTLRELPALGEGGGGEYLRARSWFVIGH